MTLKLTLHLLHVFVVEEGFSVSKMCKEDQITKQVLYVRLCWQYIIALYSTWNLTT